MHTLYCEYSVIQNTGLQYLHFLISMAHTHLVKSTSYRQGKCPHSTHPPDWGQLPLGHILLCLYAVQIGHNLLPLLYHSTVQWQLQIVIVKIFDPNVFLNWSPVQILYGKLVLMQDVAECRYTDMVDIMECYVIRLGYCLLPFFDHVLTLFLLLSPLYLCLSFLLSLPPCLQSSHKRGELTWSLFVVPSLRLILFVS